MTVDCFEFGFVSWTLTFHIFQNQVFFPNATASITWATITSLKLLFDIQERKVISQLSVSLLNCPISSEKFFPTWASLEWLQSFGALLLSQTRNKQVFSMIYKACCVLFCIPKNMYMYKTAHLASWLHPVREDGLLETKLTVTYWISIFCCLLLNTWWLRFVVELWNLYFWCISYKLPLI